MKILNATLWGTQGGFCLDPRNNAKAQDKLNKLEANLPTLKEKKKGVKAPKWGFRKWNCPHWEVEFYHNGKTFKKRFYTNGEQPFVLDFFN